MDKIKGFFDKKKLDKKFKKAGTGHTLTSRSQPKCSKTAPNQTAERKESDQKILNKNPAMHPSSSGRPSLDKDKRAPNRSPQKQQRPAGRSRSLDRKTSLIQNGVLRKSGSYVSNEGTSYRHAQPQRPSVAQSVESQLAGQAALLRIEKKSQHNQTQSSIVKAAKAQAQRELDDESKAKAAHQSSLSSKPSEKQFESAPVLECILLVCPFCSESFPRQEIDNHMLLCLREQMGDDPSVVSVTMFLSCNRNPDKLQAGKDIFIRVFNNIIANPAEEKFQKLKCSTNAYKDKIEPMLGHAELLGAAGFELNHIQSENSPGSTDSIWINANPDVERLTNLVAMLKDGQAMKPTLDRQAKLLHPKDILSFGPIYYPDDFYNLNKEEIAREHQMRRERVEKELQLRTKAMRERDAQQEVRKYNFTLIRIRFPNNTILQLVFRAFEKFGDILSYLTPILAYECIPYTLLDSTGQTFDEATFLSDLGLVPAAVLNFQWDEAVLNDVIAQNPKQEIKFLSDEYLDQIS
ncbi:UBX domain-containing protein 6-like isoform X2 [Convolutriloba macropyga]|uniref:UBX domain-containing protein 6-like isoform X2 n=1 Tax=Convolutriloba macropyga TaxID=536237 RepID=UPI003F527E5D